MASPTDPRRRQAFARRCWLLLSWLLLAVPPWPQPAVAASDLVPGSQISRGGWEGGAVVDEKGDFSVCFVVARVGDYLLGFDLYDDAGLGISFARDGWTVTPGSESPLVLRVDETAKRNGIALGLEDYYFVDLRRDPAFVAALRAGRTLYIVASGATIPLDLVGSGAGAALGALEQCLITHAGIDVAGRPAGGGAPAQGNAGGSPIEGGGSGGGSPGVERNPFAPAGAPAPATGGGASGDDYAGLRQALVAAGYPDPQFQESESGVVLWTSKRTNIVGGFTVKELRGSVHTLVQNSVVNLGPDCAVDSQLLYDKIGRNSLGEVYSGRVDCRGGHVFFATFQTDSSAIAMFVHIVPSYEDTLGQQLNANLRRYLLSL